MLQAESSRVQGVDDSLVHREKEAEEKSLAADKAVAKAKNRMADAQQ